MRGPFGEHGMAGDEEAAVEMDDEGAGAGVNAFGDAHPDGEFLGVGESLVGCLGYREGGEFWGGQFVLESFGHVGLVCGDGYFEV